MAQQNAGSLAMRAGKDESGPKQNRQVQAYSRKASGRAHGKAAHAGKPGKPLETQAQWGGDQTLITWEMRCPDLGHNEWARFSGPPDAWRTVRAWAEALDHDEARPIGWGKEVEIEARRWGRSNVEKFKVTGEIRYRYHVKATT